MNRAATIKMCLFDEVMYHVMDEKSLAAIWLKLIGESVHVKVIDEQAIS